MYSIGRWLLPYAMVVGGLLLLVGTVPVIIGGAEPSPTSVMVSDLSVDTPKARWLKLTGGGLYLPDAVVDEEITESTGARKTKAWYVPFVSQSEAIEKAKALVEGTAVPSFRKLVLIRFSPDEFLRNYPTPENLKPDDVFRPLDVEGLRSSNLLFPDRLKDYIRAELKLPLESVAILKYGDKPMQRDEAMKMSVVLFVLIMVGVFWIAMRFRRPNQSPQPEEHRATAGTG